MCVDSGRVVRGCSSGASACRKESTDLLLRRKGARRWKLPGEQGICTRALWEGTTVSPGDSQGGTLERALRSSSGENTGLSIPRRKGSSWSAPQVKPGQQGRGVPPRGHTPARPAASTWKVTWKVSGSMLCVPCRPSTRGRQGECRLPSLEQRTPPATHTPHGPRSPHPMTSDHAHSRDLRRASPPAPHLRGSLSPWCPV